MKKLMLSLALLSGLAFAQANTAAASVIDQCYHKGSHAWKCNAQDARYVDLISWSPSDFWGVLLRTYWSW